MDLTLKGQYTIKSGDSVIYSKNNIQTDGFQLVRNWFVSDKNEFKLVDLGNAQISHSNIIPESLVNVQDVFIGNKNQFATTQSSTNAYFQLIWGDKQQENLQQIDAIGVDVVYVGSNAKKNANLLISYLDDTGGQKILKSIDEFPIPVAHFSNSIVSHKQTIFEFNNSFKTNRIKIQFNKFCDDKIQYQIYAINFYTKKKMICSPQQITLYQQVEGKSTPQPIISKPIQTKFAKSQSNSIVYKVNLQFDQIVDKGQVVAISTDFYNYEESSYQTFSYSSFDQPWKQQMLQIIQLQYQLSFGDANNSGGESSGSDEPSDNSIGEPSDNSIGESSES